MANPNTNKSGSSTLRDTSSSSSPSSIGSGSSSLGSSSNSSSSGSSMGSSDMGSTLRDSSSGSSSSSFSSDSSSSTSGIRDNIRNVTDRIMSSDVRENAREVMDEAAQMASEFYGRIGGWLNTSPGKTVGVISLVAAVGLVGFYLGRNSMSSSSPDIKTY